MIVHQFMIQSGGSYCGQMPPAPRDWPDLHMYDNTSNSIEEFHHKYPDGHQLCYECWKDLPVRTSAPHSSQPIHGWDDDPFDLGRAL